MSEPYKSVLSDAQIMAQTTVAESPGGRLRFATKLPSGRDVEGVFSASAKAAGVIKWCEAVNQAIEADEQEERAKQKRKWQEEQLRPGAVQLVGPDSKPIVPYPSIPPLPAAGTTSSTPAAASLSSNPLEFVRQALQAAESTEKHWEVQANLALQALEKARRDVQQWRAVATSLSLPPSGISPAATIPGQKREAVGVQIPMICGISDEGDSEES